MIAIFPETLAFAEKGMVEHIAISVRRTFETKPMLKLDVWALVERIGIKIEQGEFPGLGVLVAKDGSGRFSASMILSRKNLEKEDSPSIQFLLAHQLGHYFIHLQPMIARGELDASGYRESVCPLRRYALGGQDRSGVNQAGEASLEQRREMECDHFASALLMPKGMILRAFEKIRDLEKISELFGVTVHGLTRRLEDLNALPRSPQGFLEAEATLKSHPPKASLEQSQELLVKSPAMEKASLVGPRGMARIREIAKMLDKNQN